MTRRDFFKKRLRFNRITSNVFSAVVFFFSLLMVIPLVLILAFILVQGVGHLSLHLLINDQRNNGILNTVVGSLQMVFLAVLLAVPVSIFVGIFLGEAPKTSRSAYFLRLTVDVFQGIPSIILGIIAYVWLVIPLHSFSALAGSVALAIMMIPIVIKSTEESLILVPNHLKEAAYALGAPFHKVILQVTLPAALSGVLTGVLLATSRILGETAPLLFTAFGSPDLSFNMMHPMEAVPTMIFKYAQSPVPDWINTAWAASFLLVAAVLLLNLGTKWFVKKWKN
jgi:phosphate transport system permease protein